MNAKNASLTQVAELAIRAQIENVTLAPEVARLVALVQAQPSYEKVLEEIAQRPGDDNWVRKIGEARFSIQIRAILASRELTPEEKDEVDRLLILQSQYPKPVDAPVPPGTRPWVFHEGPPKPRGDGT